MEQPKSKDTQKELEIALNELEERVDRLRALYEQYFMGYEKLEPSVPRKDVERRFVALRKQQLRNTAMRFRFNVISQKFNTYAMYWTRVCRQIEEGTFKRHVAKAARRFGATELTPQMREQEQSIDVELGELELDEDDLDAVLAEANAAAEAQSRGRPDTTPPPPPSRPALGRPVTPNAEMRVARHAALPPGARQPLVRRQETPQAFEPVGAPPSSSSAIVRPPAESPAPAVHSAGRMPLAPPAGGTGAHPSAARIAATPATSANRIPVAREGAPSANRVPISQPRPYQPATAVRAAPEHGASANRIPVAQPQPQPLPAASATRIPAAGMNRIPVAQPQSPPDSQPRPPPAASANRIPVSPVSPRTPGPYRPVALPPGSVNRIATRTPMSPAGARPEASHGKTPVAEPSGPDSEPPRPSRRPPPVLPSQLNKKP